MGTEVYDLIANIVHDGHPKDGTYRVHCLHQETGTWKELQDLVVSDALPEMIPLSEAFIQIWLRRPKVGLHRDFLTLFVLSSFAKPFLAKN